MRYAILSAVTTSSCLLLAACGGSGGKDRCRLGDAELRNVSGTPTELFPEDLADIKAIDGDLYVDWTTAAEELSLPCLTRVTGTISVEGIKEVRLDNIEFAGGIWVISSAESDRYVESFAAPRLAEAGGIGVQGTPTVDLSALSRLDGGLGLYGWPAPPELDDAWPVVEIGLETLPLMDINNAELIAPKATTWPATTEPQNAAVFERLRGLKADKLESLDFMAVADSDVDLEFPNLESGGFDFENFQGDLRLPKFETGFIESFNYTGELDLPSWEERVSLRLLQGDPVINLPNAKTANCFHVALTSIRSLANVAPMSPDQLSGCTYQVSINENPDLSQCEVEAWIEANDWSDGKYSARDNGPC